MCDYSLAHFPNRLAVEGEQLVVHRFRTGTLGLTPARFSLKQIFSPDSTPAVCVPPGARLLLQDLPERLQQALNVGRSKKLHLWNRAPMPSDIETRCVLPMAVKSSCSSWRPASAFWCWAWILARAKRLSQIR